MVRAAHLLVGVLVIAQGAFSLASAGQGPTQDELLEELAARIRGLEGPVFHQLLLAVALHSGQSTVAQEAHDALAAQGMDTPQVRLAHARSLMAQGEPGAGAAILEQLLRDDPEDAQVLLELARHHLRQGAFADAVALLERAVEVEPSSPEIRYELARAYLQAAKFEESIEHAGVALLLERPASPRAGEIMQLLIRALDQLEP